LIYCLLPNLQFPTYQTLLQILKHKAIQISHVFSPKTIQIDFEMAVIKAIEEELPYTEIKGCFFHYAQAIWRKIKNIGLCSLFKSDSGVRRWARKCISLPLFPPEYIEEAWLILHAEAPNYPQITTLLNYILETWVDETARFDRYGIIINVHITTFILPLHLYIQLL